MKPCPYCAELIQDQAAKCRYCGEWLDPSKRPAWSQEATKAAAIATAPSNGQRRSLDDEDDDDRREDTAATLPVGSGLADLARRDQEPPRTWSAPAWLANAQAARVEPREEVAPTDRSTLEEVALRMERIRQSAAAVRESVDPSPRAVRPTAPERATLEVEPGVTLPAGSLRAVGIEPREPARAVRNREPGRTVAPTRPAPVVHDEDEFADFEDEPLPPPRQRVRPDPEERLRSERPTVPDIPREQLMGEAVRPEPARQPDVARSERPTKKIVLSDSGEHELVVAPTERVRNRRAELPPDPELPGPPTERIRKRRVDEEPHETSSRRAALTSDDLDDAPPPPRASAGSNAKKKAPAPVPPPVVLDDDEDETEGDDEPPPRTGAVAFDDDFLDEDEDGEGDDEGFEDFGPAPAAPRPLPWRPILIAAGVIVVAGVLLFRDALFPSSDPETDEAATKTGEDGEPAQDADAKDAAKAQPEPAPKAAGEGQPVQPDTKADPGAGGPVAAEAGQPPAPAQPSALDPAAKAKLDEARKTYDAANANPRKLEPVGAALREILAKSPDNPEALTFIAQVYLEQGKMDESLETASHCTRVSPTTAACWLTVGVIQDQVKHAKASAKDAYQRYLDLDPQGRYARDAKQALKRLK